jgi:uncharacterized membrane protein (DUF106 family)
MNPYVLVLVLGIMVIIFGSIFGSKMVKDYMVYKDRMHKRQQEMDAEFASEVLEKQKGINKQFEERIQALEAIVTSENYDLKEKIKNL